MLTINKKYKSKVAALRRKVALQQKQQDSWILKLAKEAGINTSGDDFETLWDHVMNETDWTVKYE
jgi:hypothetical protein